MQISKMQRCKHSMKTEKDANSEILQAIYCSCQHGKDDDPIKRDLLSDLEAAIARDSWRSEYRYLGKNTI
jgi:hypothetical protein